MNVIQESDEGQTEALAARLAEEVEGGRKPVLSFAALFTLGVALAAAGAFLVVLGVVGHRSDLPQVWQSFTFLFKVASTGLAVAGAILLLRRSATPGLPIRPFPLLVPAFVLLVAGASLDRSGFPLTGLQTLSVLKCVGSIVLASLPALAALFITLRRGAPTDLVRAGASAGLLAGSLGAAAYAPACVNDGFAFVALWYSTAIVITTTIGAALGPRTLAW